MSSSRHHQYDENLPAEGEDLINNRPTRIDDLSDDAAYTESFVYDMSQISMGESAFILDIESSGTSIVVTHPAAAELPPPDDQTTRRPRIAVPNSTSTSAVKNEPFLPKSPQTGVNAVHNWRLNSAEALERGESGISNALDRIGHSYIGLQHAMDGVVPPMDLPSPHEIRSRKYGDDMLAISQKKEKAIEHAKAATAGLQNKDPNEAKSVYNHLEGQANQKFEFAKTAVLDEAFHLGNSKVKPGNTQSMRHKGKGRAAPHTQSNQDASVPVLDLEGPRVKGGPQLIVPQVQALEQRLDANMDTLAAEVHSRPFAIWTTSATPHPKPKSDQILARDQLFAPGIAPPPALTPAMHQPGNCAESPALAELVRIAERDSLDIYTMRVHDTVVMHVVALNENGQVANNGDPIPLCLVCHTKVRFEMAKAERLGALRTIFDNGTGITYTSRARSETGSN